MIDLLLNIEIATDNISICGNKVACIIEFIRLMRMSCVDASALSLRFFLSFFFFFGSEMLELCRIYLNLWLGSDCCTLI